MRNMQSGTGKRAEKAVRRRKRRIKCILILLLCIILSFWFGKMVGRAEKKQAEGPAEQVGSAIRPGQALEGWEEGCGGAEEKTEDVWDLAAIEDPECLILVNRDNPLPEDYQPELVTLQDGVHESAKIAYDSLRDMLRAGIREGLTFEICSAYRSVERQRKLFEEDVNALMRQGWSYEEAYAETAKETMPPGCSEHSTGLAFDIVSFNYQMLDERQETTPENIWLREHCSEYGFILRYPKSGEEITGIRYESWHFRYVGREAAAYITEEEITLEEFWQRQQIAGQNSNLRQ